MKHHLLLLLSFLAVSCGEIELSDYVDPFIGTDAHGHTYPGAATPFGLVQLSPDTGTEGWDWCSGYHSSDNSIIGFSHSHLSGTGGADLGDILFMPGVGEVFYTPGTKENPDVGYRSRFSHSSEDAHAGYYTVYLDDPKVKAELTATAHTGVHRYRFDNPEGQYLIIDLNHGIQDNSHSAYIRLVDKNTVEGWRRSNGWADDHTVYFYARFDQPIAKMEVSVDGKTASVDSVSGKQVVAALFFEGEQKEVVAKVGISYVDLAGAKKNFETEVGDKSFDQVHSDARAKWNTELGKVTVKGEDKETKKIFYTALYHSMLSPYGMSDVDGRYIGSDRKIHSDTTSINYGLFSFWDTFRALHPLMTIVEPQKNQEFIKSLIRYYEQSGRLPVWDLNMRENNCMIGYHAIPVIADAYMKGQRDFDANKALEAMVHSAMQEDYAGVQYYREFGYLPMDKENNSVSKALEYAYDDWCIAQMAKELGNDSLHRYFTRRAQSYKNHFDPADGFMKGRNSQGQLRAPFSPTDISILGQGDFTEGNAWHYSFFVPQDVNTHIALLGGDDKYVAKLDEMFNSETVVADHSPDVSGLIGNYAQGNEPSHHAAYLYSYAGQPWKTQERIAQIKNELYTTKRDGLCGNEDCGQMSAWYVLSAMGFYPVTPGSGIYVLGTPSFEEMTITSPNGKTFTIKAENFNKENIYIQSADWNGKPYTKSYINHSMIEEGGVLTLKMGNVANKSFGAAAADRPVSQIVEGAQTSEQMLSSIVFEPYFENKQRVFTDFIEIEPKQHSGQTIVYTLDGSEPTAWSAKVKDKIVINSDKTLKIRGLSPEGRMSSVGTYKFFKGLLSDATINGTEPSEPYNKSGLKALTDGVTGGANYMNPQWVGFVGKDVELEIKLNTPKFISGVGFNTMNAPGAWIILPFGASAKYYLAGTEVGTRDLIIPEANTMPWGDYYFTLPAFVKVDSVKLTLKGGLLPQWHTSKGNGAWIFIDEVTLF